MDRKLKMRPRLDKNFEKGDLKRVGPPVTLSEKVTSGFPVSLKTKTHLRFKL